MWKKIKKQLEKIQNSNEAVKKRWLVGTTLVSMVIVVALWIIYINFTTRLVAEKPEIREEPTTGFWQTFKNGLGIIFDSSQTAVKNLFSEITKSRTIDIK